MRRVSKRTAYVYQPKMPALLAEAQKRVRTFENQPYKYFPDLALRPGHVKTTYIQFRRKIVTTLCTNLACMDEPSLNICYPVPGTNPQKFSYYTTKQLTKRSGLYRRGWQRASAAANRYVSVDPRAKGNKEKGYEGFAAVRRVDVSFLHRIGLYEDWVAACDDADQQRKNPGPAALVTQGVVNPTPQTDEERAAAARERAMRLNAELLSKVRGNDTS